MAFHADAAFVPDRSLGYLIRRTHLLQADALAAAFDEQEITLTQWQALIAIHFGYAGTGAELARNLHHDKGATTRLVDSLESRGWVVRTRDDDDRRCVRLALTADGEAVAQRSKQRVIACWNEWIADWADADVEQLIALLQRLEKTLTAAAGEK